MDNTNKSLDKEYDKDLVVDQTYIDKLPDMQNGQDIKGANVKIQRVGVSNFKIPLTFRTKDGGKIVLETSVTGTVSLEAHTKGINMSRLVRSFYEYKDNVFSIDLVEQILKDYQKNLGAFEADIVLKITYPMLQQSLRSGLEGYQFYNIALEGKIDKEGNFRKIIHFDFIYSSACPCSYELGMHAMETRNKPFVSHSQRSIARVSLDFKELIWFEDIRDLCIEALKTEVQVIVKREDEQAFAELNGVYQKFVEDACRLMYEVLEKDNRILDFRVICSHFESLHKHSAIGIITKGVQNGFASDVEVDVFKMLELSQAL